MKIDIFPIYANKFCDAGQVPILRNFEAWTRDLGAAGSSLTGVTALCP